MTKKVLFISYDGMTDPLGQSQVIPYLSGLSDKGFQITILSFEKMQAYAQSKQKIESLFYAKQIKWVPKIYTKNPPVLSTVKDIYTMYNEAKKICKSQGIDIIHCRSYIAALVGLKLKETLKVKFLFDMRGFWADERVDGGLWNISNPLYKFIYSYFKEVEIRSLTNADSIVCLTEASKNEMLTWPALPQTSKIYVVPCCVDEKLFIPQEPDAVLKQALQIKDEDIVLSYLGSVGTWYLIDEMLAFFKEFNKKYTNAKFLFITPDDPDVIKLASSKNYITEDKLIIVKANREEVPKYLALSKLSIFFIKPLYSKMASSPTKQAEVLSMGIPIICNSKIGDTDQIVNSEQVGIVVESFTSEGYSNAMQRMPMLLELSKEKIRSVVLNRFTLKDGVDIYATIYDSL